MTSIIKWIVFNLALHNMNYTHTDKIIIFQIGRFLLTHNLFKKHLPIMTSAFKIILKNQFFYFVSMQ